MPAAPDKMTELDVEGDVRTVNLVSLGCPKNLVDSERMLGLLAEDGIGVTDAAEEADAVVINTCGFLEASKEESLGEIREAVALKAAGKVKRVVVAGCLVQRHKADLLDAEPGIDRLVGVFDREHIVDAVRGRRNPRDGTDLFVGRYHDLSDATDVRRPEHPAPNDGTKAAALLEKQARRKVPLKTFEDDRGRLRLTPRHYAYLRMSEGCNQGCAFCTIPSIRGPMRSKPLTQIVAEARELAADGAQELLLIGQDTTSYGVDVGQPGGLVELLRTLDTSLPDVQWLRLMYAYPSCFTDAMIDTLAACRKVLPYIDMPLQHINSDVLARMRRKVTREETLELLGKLRERVPGIALRTTFIAGSPGETEAEHEELVGFVRGFGFDMMGVFGYSPEPGTPMGRRGDQVPQEVIDRRVEELMLAQQEVAFARTAAMVGDRMEVLVDSVAGEVDEGGTLYAGRTYRQAPDIDSLTYVHDPQSKLKPGQFVTAKLTGAEGYDHVAEVHRPTALTVMG